MLMNQVFSKGAETPPTPRPWLCLPCPARRGSRVAGSRRGHLSAPLLIPPGLCLSGPLCLCPARGSRPSLDVCARGGRSGMSVQGLTGPRGVHLPGAHRCADTGCSDSDNTDLGFKATSPRKDCGLKRNYTCSSCGHVHRLQGCPCSGVGRPWAACVADGEVVGT